MLVAKQPAGLQARGLVVLAMVEQFCSATSGRLRAMVGLFVGRMGHGGLVCGRVGFSGLGRLCWAKC